MKPRHAPAKMTRAYNVATAYMKIDTAPLDKLDASMIESIARTHRVPVETLAARLAERKARAT